MCAEYANEIMEEDFYYGQAERPSDIQLPPVMNVLLLSIWAAICLIGFAVMVLGKNLVAGTIIIAVPTFIGMVIKPTFALCIMMLVLPTGAGFAYRTMFSLDRGIGIALAIAFALNWLITRPSLRLSNKALWVPILYTIWVFLVSLAGPYLGLELRRAFTQFQLLILALIVYWIIQANGEKTYRWALRAFVIGVLGTNAIASITGAARVAVEEMPERRYAATIGAAVEPNMLAAITCMAFFASLYLFARDKRIFWRVVYLVAIVVLPVVLLQIGSRGAAVAFAFTVLSPLLFVRQVLRRPVLVLLLLVGILLGSLSAGWLVRERGLEAPVARRLTDIGYARDAIGYRMLPVKKALQAAVDRPAGTSYYGWFEWSGLRHIPHNDFFLALGMYGIPAAILFALFILLMMLTVRRMPLGLEKLYARAVLTFLIVMGLSMAQVFLKHFWVFLVIVMASAHISLSYAEVGRQQYGGEIDGLSTAD
jgi:O-antigen ligase